MEVAANAMNEVKVASSSSDAPKALPSNAEPMSAQVSRVPSDAAKDAAQYALKYKNYERDYLLRLNHKYFSGKNLTGTGRVFETVTTVDGFFVKESRDPPVKRFLDHARSSDERSRSGAPSTGKVHVNRKF